MELLRAALMTISIVQLNPLHFLLIYENLRVSQPDIHGHQVVVEVLYGGYYKHVLLEQHCRIFPPSKQR